MQAVSLKIPLRYIVKEIAIFYHIVKMLKVPIPHSQDGFGCYRHRLTLSMLRLLSSKT